MSEPIRVLVTGAAGRMGKEVTIAIENDNDMVVVGLVDTAFGKDHLMTPQERLMSGDLARAIKETKPDVMVDFTSPDSVMSNLTKAIFKGVHCVVGTTGLAATDLMTLETHCKHNRPTNVFIAPNFAIGAVLMMQFAEQAARFMEHAEIVELHHDKKLDAPSGTALRTAELIASARNMVNAPDYELARLSGFGIPGDENNPARGKDVDHIRVHSVRLPGLVAHQEVIFGGQGQTLTIRHDSIDRTSFMPGVLLAIRKVAELPYGVTVGLERLLDSSAFAEDAEI